MNQTIGINGRIALQSLFPVITEGAQTVSIDRIDFSALQLENGEIQFALADDNKLRIERAFFPWFGGSIGVYDMQAALDGGNTRARLEAKDVDLAAILAFVDVDGLSGEGILAGTLPLIVEDRRARIEQGLFRSVTPGVVRYQGEAGDAAASAGADANIAFSILRNLEYESLEVAVDGPLDGRLDFQMAFDGHGEVPINKQDVRVPVKYTINLDAALLDLFNQVNLSRNLEMQIKNAVDENVDDEGSRASGRQAK